MDSELIPGGFAMGSLQSIKGGGCYALDDLCGTRDTLDVGAGERLHDGRIYSYSAGYRNRCGVDQNHPGTKTLVNDLEVLIYRGYIY